MSAADPGRITAAGASETTAPKSRAADGVGSRSATGPNTSLGLWMKLADEQSTQQRHDGGVQVHRLERHGSAS